MTNDAKLQIDAWAPVVDIKGELASRLVQSEENSC